MNTIEKIVIKIPIDILKKIKKSIDIEDEAPTVTTR